MSSLYDDLKQGLEEAIDYEKGKGEAKVKVYEIKPVHEYSNVEIRAIRMKSGMTQRVFAYYMGVSQKTVEAWESGKSHPTGPVFRLLNMLDNEEVKDKEYVIAK